MRRYLPAICLIAGLPGSQAGDPPVFTRPDRPRLLTYGGTVTAADSESVTIRGYDLQFQHRGGVRTERAADGVTWVTTGEQMVIFGQNGVFREGCRTMSIIRVENGHDRLDLHPEVGQVVTLHLEDQPARRFVARGALAEGSYSKREMWGSTYRLADVQIGDRVKVNGTVLNGVEYIEAISIRRRPGGRVPPAPGQVADPLFIPNDSRFKDPQPWYHERMNAEQDWEERGVPIPDKYHPGGPIPGVAPMPRPAGVPAPASSGPFPYFNLPGRPPEPKSGP